MRTFARWSTTHRAYVAIAWVLALIAAGALARAAGTAYSNNFTLPRSDAQRASDLLRQSFPAQAGDRDQIVFRVATGTVLDRPVRTRMSATFARVARLPHVTELISPYTAAGARAISANRQIAFATVLFDQRANQLPAEAVKRVVATALAAGGRGLQVEMGGQAVESVQSQSFFGLATGIGLAAAVIVLLLTFGSLVAMGLPIVTALFGLGTGLGLIALLTHAVDTPDFSSELAAMIGLGVGIDYALFIVTRFREAYATPGATHEDVRESVIQAIDTAGRAVLFAGSTVVIALLGMMLLGVVFLYGVALSAAIAVLLVMLGSLTLLPALMTIAGRRLARSGWRAVHHGHHAHRSSDAREVEVDATPDRISAWLRWSAFVQRRPVPIAIAATLLMLTIAAPVLALRLGSSDASSDPPNLTTHRAYQLLAAGFGKGFNGPLTVVARREGGVHDLSAVQAAIAATPGVAAVVPAHVNPTGRVAVLSVYPTSAPQAYATAQLVSRLRQRVVPPVESRTGMRIYVGGVTAGSVDFANTLAAKLPLFIGVVVGLSALLLLIVFRSWVIPLQAAFMNLLSIGASLGVIVAIFQWGWLGGLMGVSSGPIQAFIPVMLFAIVFGLSMDYEVFLISRIHEQWAHRGDSRRAVGEGLALTGRVITAAGAIMVCVFLSFMVADNRVIKEFGLSLATAVFLDAVVVRCMLVPAALDIIGERTWRIPRWLDRLLPHMKIEGRAPHVEVDLDGRVTVEPEAAEPPERIGAGLEE